MIVITGGAGRDRQRTVGYHRQHLSFGRSWHWSQGCFTVKPQSPHNFQSVRRIYFSKNSKGQTQGWLCRRSTYIQSRVHEISSGYVPRCSQTRVTIDLLQVSTLAHNGHLVKPASSRINKEWFFAAERGLDCPIGLAGPHYFPWLRSHTNQASIVVFFHPSI